MRVTLDNPQSDAAPYGDRFAHVARMDMADGALLLLSGQVAVDDEGSVIAPGDVAAQSERIFEVLTQLLAAHGATLGDVVHSRTFMTNLDDLPASAQVRRRHVTRTPPPASTTVEVSRLFLPGIVIEIEITAAVNNA